MKILVTGVAGFIGSHVAMCLLARGNHVVGIDNLNDYYDVNLKKARLKRIEEIDKGQFEFHQLDITDKKSIANLFATSKFTHVIHLAAQAGVRHSLTHPHDYIDNNITGFLTILEGCRHYPVQHLVYASSSSVYGLNTHMPFSVTSNVDHPVSLYAASKKANELMAHAYSHLYQIPTTGLRFFTVYGPWGRPDMALFKFTQAILQGQTIDVYNQGNMQRDFTYIDDIVTGIIKVLDNPATSDATWDSNKPNPATSSAPYRLYNIGNNQPVKLLDYIAAIEKALGKKAQMNLLPLQAGDVPNTYADVDSLVKAINYKPTTDILSGIKKFTSWYTSYYK